LNGMSTICVRYIAKGIHDDDWYEKTPARLLSPLRLRVWKVPRHPRRRCEGYRLGCNEGAAAGAVMSADRVALIIPR